MSFELRVEFEGLCIYVSDCTGRLGVIMPDGRLSNPTLHPDKCPRTPHVGYMRFNAADVGGYWSSAPNYSPNFEIVHRFYGQTLQFDLEPGRVHTASPGTIILPPIDKFAKCLALRPKMFGDDPPKELLMRTVLPAGGLAMQTSGVPGVWHIDDRLDGDKAGGQSGVFANFATWTRTIYADFLVLRLVDFHGQVQDVIRLFPSNKESVEIKIANLCANNPLEWGDLDTRTVPAGSDDDDFRWLYHLLQPRHETWQQLIDRINDVLPVPQPNDKKMVSENCFGATIQVDDLFGT